MSVLFITRKYPPSIGGMELFAYDLSNALKDFTTLRLIKWGGTGRTRAVFWALPLLGIQATKALLQEKTDIIHAQDGLLAPLAFILSRLFRRPYVVVVHGLDVTYANPFFRMFVLPAIRHANVIIAISQAASLAAQTAGVDSAKISIVPLAVADKMYGIKSRNELIEKIGLPVQSKILLTVGRLVRRKGVAWFIKNVLPELVNQFPGLAYIIVGEGVERRNIEETICTSGMAKHVMLLGKASEDVLVAAYNSADVFVMPNIRVPNDIEGFGLVLLEASLCAVPVVAADVDGIQDAVTDGKNAVLVPATDKVAYIERIGFFLSKSREATKFGEQSRNFTLTHYAWAPIAEKYLTIYKTLAK